MGDIFLRKYGVETKVDFALYKLDGTGLKTDAASASGDVNLFRDEGATEQLDADAFVDEGTVYSITLSAAEMTAARIIVTIVDQSGPQVWLDKTLIVETYGNASAQHVFDLGTATQSVSVTQIGGVVQSLTDFKDFVDTGYDPATHKVQGLVTADALTANNDKTGYALSAAGVDAILDEEIDGNAPANADSLRETVNVIAAACAGKLSGAGTGTLTFKSLGDDKARITATMDVDNNRTAVTQDGT